MNAWLRLDFRFLEQKNTRGCSAVPFRRDSPGLQQTQRADMSRNCLFGFRNRKFAPAPVEQGVFIILGAFIIFAMGQK
jgi:hypothetical protein